MNKSRDLELLSSFLDGQLSPSDSARLEQQLSRDPELAAAVKDMRAARSFLRNLPVRKVPKNFTLNRKMVAARPPVPPAFSFFRLSSAVATVLLLFTFVFRAIPASLSFGAAAPATSAYESGGSDVTAQQAPAATELSAATEAPAVEPLASDSARLIPTATIAPPAAFAQPQNGAAPVPAGPNTKAAEPAVLSPVQNLLLVIGAVCAAISLSIYLAAKRRWS